MMPLILAAALLVPTAAPAPAATTTRACKVVGWLRAGGFTGTDLRVGWAVVMRESGGDPHQITNGVDRGLWQINRPTHPNLSYSLVMDPVRSSRWARKQTRHGNWRPWGLAVRNGRVYRDYRDYVGIWSDSRMEAWIWEPFARYYRRFPRGC